MKSTDPNFDWHAVGVWIMHHAVAGPLVETANMTPYGCRAEYIRMANRPWSQLVKDGFFVQGYAPMETPHLRVQEQVTTDEAHWRYPVTGRPEDQPPSGEMWLLTEGRTSVKGVWRDDGGYIAWFPNIRRDKALETAYGLLKGTTG